MNDYMRALHQRFFREPEYPGIQRKLDRVYRNLQKSLPQRDQDRLLDLADLEIELREEVSLASFTAVSGRPTMSKPGRPLEMKTSTSTS